MDKHWMQIDDRMSREYLKGVEDFLQFAFAHTEEDVIPCPCTHCNNGDLELSKEEVRAHLIMWGIVKGYTRWLYHGEFTAKEKQMCDKMDLNVDSDDILDMIHDAAGPNVLEAISKYDDEQEPNETSNFQSLKQNEEAFKFLKLLKAAQQPLYPGCENFTKLSLIVKLFQIKCLYGLSDTAVNAILKLFKEALPSDDTLPDSFQVARKMIRDLGLHYDKIDACENDCMLFWKEHEKAEHCLICGQSRWKEIETKTNKGPKHEKCGKKIPRKVLRYFPLKKRLQRLFMSTKTASDMRWHDEQRPKDGVIRHPADSDAWKSFDLSHPAFSKEPRNVRLGLATDGVNPFGNMSVSHSTWPVIIVVYNLPPWMCMKQPFCMLSLLIHGPKAPGNDIDVYLQPLIEELRELWYDGVDTYDASKKENFRMHAALLWTINDFPAYAVLSGWSTKGALACPSCNRETPSYRLKHGHKFCYMGARRFLHSNHKWRKNKAHFNGKVEKRAAPPVLSGDDVLNQLKKLPKVTFGKGVKRKRNYVKKETLNCRKSSIFFRLPYWRGNFLRHNLDVMHIEKNIFDNIVGTLLDIKGKTKDNLKSRRDLKEMGIREELHPSKDNNEEYPAACYNLSTDEISKICQFLKEIKVPNGYSSNIARCVNLKEGKIFGLKSHDSHILLERLFPLASRGIVPTEVCEAITELSIFFRKLCSKVLTIEQLEYLESQIPITLCKLERIFPPSFFDVMVHLSIHLASEAKLGGPVQFRWMYPIERFLRKLKCYVRNKSRPEGSIAEGYNVEECLIFCSRYLNDIETSCSQSEKNFNGNSLDSYKGLSVFTQTGYSLSNDKCGTLSDRERNQAHHYVLRNCEEVQSLIEQYEYQNQNLDLSEWFHHRVIQLCKEKNAQVNEEIVALARGPLPGVQRFTGKGVKIDKYGFVSVKTTRKLNTDEPFVLASQVEQVYYVKDGLNPGWLIALKGQSRTYNLPLEEVPNIDTLQVDEDAFQQNTSCLHDTLYTLNDDDDDLLNLKRDDISPIIEASTVIVDDNVESETQSDDDTDDDDSDTDEDLML
ncbi:hypothetical protein SLA2020_162040 [Shorea laevis]